MYRNQKIGILHEWLIALLGIGMIVAAAIVAGAV
jgi:hypothetical protein